MSQKIRKVHKDLESSTVGKIFKNLTFGFWFHLQMSPPWHVYSQAITSVSNQSCPLLLNTRVKWLCQGKEFFFFKASIQTVIWWPTGNFTVVDLMRIPPWSKVKGGYTVERRLLSQHSATATVLYRVYVYSLCTDGHWSLSPLVVEETLSDHLDSSLKAHPPYFFLCEHRCMS